MTGPASEELHVLEGHCTCEPVYEEYVTGGLLFEPDIRRRVQTDIIPSVHCGLSAHRVLAARRRVEYRLAVERSLEE